MGFEFRCHGCGELPELQGIAEDIRPGASITRDTWLKPYPETMDLKDTGPF